jgi:hypothetical protein
MPDSAKRRPSDPIAVQSEPGVGIGTRRDRSDNSDGCARFDRHWVSHWKGWTMTVVRDSGMMELAIGGAGDGPGFVVLGSSD